MLIGLGILMGVIFLEIYLLTGAHEYVSSWRDVATIFGAILVGYFLIIKLKGTQHR
ncbi:MAG: hypothetical protein H6582_14500 [Crocinitomicaceae bacterium]|nr:hypothetical protein [Crocinitomicaceae bacterium]